MNNLIINSIMDQKHSEYFGFTVDEIMEMAAMTSSVKFCSEDELKELSKKALQQIIDKQYDTELREAGVTDVIKYGVAFCGKRVEIAVG
ncbi:MAG: PD-(D/E)XK nuclease domain-containing protein [Lachnospiraceae bacterium]|nr:PD-(D/E)XK nuclease domain-containing protein [Lachnospiraceae bacterium]MDD7178996.1 PD-(D/E)XK nuclease domain-containing protein [bacterium]